MLRSRIKRSIITVLIGLAINVALAGVKLYVGLKTNSLTIMLDATNSTFDVVTAMVTAVAFAALLAPVSERARYGYGRCEYLASFIVAAASVAVGVIFFVRSLNRLAMPEMVWFGVESLTIMIVAVFFKFGLGLLYLFMNKKIKSSALTALMLDSFLDTGISAATVVSYALSGNVYYSVDSIVGIVLSVVVIAFAFKMFVDSVRILTVGDGCVEEYAFINDYFALLPQKCEVKSIELHDYGYCRKVGTTEVMSNIPHAEAEEIAKKAEWEIENKTGAKVTVIFFPSSKEDAENMLELEKQDEVGYEICENDLNTDKPHPNM